FGVAALAHGGNVTIKNSGLIQGSKGSAVDDNGSSGLLTLVNSGTIVTHEPANFAIISGSTANITNSGSVLGTVLLSPFGDTLVDFKKVMGVVQKEKVVGIIDLGDGADHFTGGANAETVRDGPGFDAY